MSLFDANLFDFEETSVVGEISALTTCLFEPAGRWYEVNLNRRLRQHTLSGGSTIESSESESDNSDADLDSDDETFLKSLDPKEWKEQDHYKVLGLSKLRYKATNGQVRQAYRKKVLLHHPDKRKAQGKPVTEDDDYFTNITRAYDILGNPQKKQSFDSVDPEFNDDIPSASDNNKERFYEKFAPVFERNARWSKKKKVPSLGTDESSRDNVDDFYSFWYSFDSWREYSYLDEEDKEKGSDRYERRYIEQDNKRERKERKKEETARMRQLIDNAYACDPRIAKYKQEDKDKKEAIKRAKKEALKARQEEEERKQKEAEEKVRQQKEEEERIAKEQAAVAKKEKEAARNAMKKERKALRNRMKEFDYFTSDESEKINNIAEMEKLAEMLSVTSLKSLNEKLKGDKPTASSAFHDEVKALAIRIESEREELLNIAAKGGDPTSALTSSKKGGKPWSVEENQLLIKAVSMFPAGTSNRWETIASFMTQHMATSERSAKEVLAQTKALQKMDSSQREMINKTAFDRAMKQTAQKASPVETRSMDDPSKRYMTPGETLVVETGENLTPWNPEEQKLLEQALRTYPNGTPERWDKIAGCLETRSKKDCMKRFKELAEMVKAKKAAAAAAAKKA